MKETKREARGSPAAFLAVRKALVLCLPFTASEKVTFKLGFLPPVSKKRPFQLASFVWTLFVQVSISFLCKFSQCDIVTYCLFLERGSNDGIIRIQILTVRFFRERTLQL